MEIRKMGELLAERCMGWSRGMGHLRSDRDSVPVWRDSNGRVMQLCCAWEPWESWSQLGMVIEAMARERFLVHMSIYTRDDGTRGAAATCSRFVPGPPPQYIHAQGASIDSGSIPLVACEAMAYALKQEANDGT